MSAAISTPIADAALAAHVGLRLVKTDPLRFRRFSSPQVRDLIRWVAQGVEGYGHAGNGAAKTDELSAFFLRLCRGQREIAGINAELLPSRDGVRDGPGEPILLPGLRNGEPWHHWVLIQSWDQGKDSTMLAYRRLLGQWPHEIGWLDRARGVIKLIRVKPDGWASDDPATWSSITFISQEGMTDEDSRYVQGARIDSAQGDEMPKESVWREVRMRARANQILYLAIGATPEYKPEWEWCFEDFRPCLMRVVGGRVRVQWSVEDNRALSHDDLLRRWEKLGGTPEDFGDVDKEGKRDPLIAARWNGVHVDITGKSPFLRQRKQLDRLLADARHGRFETLALRNSDEASDAEGRMILPVSARIERWLPYNPTHAYLGVADTSRGIDDPDYDPCEFQLWDWTDAMCVARFGQVDGVGGYLDEDSLAILADLLGRQYGGALIDGEVNGGFGVQFFLTLRKRGYPNLAHDDRSLKPGGLSDSYGWAATATANAEHVNAIIKGLSEDSFLCWSPDMVRQWLDVTERPDGRSTQVRRGVRHHREAMICAGRALHLIQTRPAPTVIQRREEVGLARALKHDFGRDIRRKPGQSRGTPELYRGNT